MSHRLKLEKCHAILPPSLLPNKECSHTNQSLRPPRPWQGRGGGGPPYLVEVQPAGLGDTLLGGGSQLLQQARELRRRQAPIRAEHAQHILAKGEPGPQHRASDARGRQQ